MKKLKVALSAGGAKHAYLQKLLESAGYDAFIEDEESVRGADYFIAPRIGDKAALTARGTVPFDYFYREDFKRKNGILTAEAAVSVAENACDAAICGADILITGFGNTARPLARALRALGGRVTVAARAASDRETALLCGYGTDTFPLTKGGYDIVFNTVPAPVLDESALMKMPDAAVIELASPPGGIAGECPGLVKAPGLPGKYMPKTAAAVIFDSFSSFVKERENDR